MDNLAADYEAIKKGVKAVMGGRILEYEAKTILRQGQMENLVPSRPDEYTVREILVDFCSGCKSRFYNKRLAAITFLHRRRRF
ncbi:MAG: hypothetical protein LUE65_12350 [Clostridiales bacterium]|nr:hypothetical protein [Clostridiales bacterium]